MLGWDMYLDRLTRGDMAFAFYPGSDASTAIGGFDEQFPFTWMMTLDDLTRVFAGAVFQIHYQ